MAPKKSIKHAAFLAAFSVAGRVKEAAIAAKIVSHFLARAAQLRGARRRIGLLPPARAPASPRRRGASVQLAYNMNVSEKVEGFVCRPWS